MKNSASRTVTQTVFKAKAPYIFSVAVAFVLFQLYLLINSFPALNQIYAIVLSRIGTDREFWSLVWFSSELVGEVGLIIRFAGACFFTAFAWILIRRFFSVSVLRRAVLLVAIHYLFYSLFIIFLFTRPSSSARDQMAALSYVIQTVLVFPTFILLSTKMRQNFDNAKLLKFGAIAVTGFVFSLWVKHFLFSLYALPIDFSSPILVFGLLNSTFTMLTATVILFFAFLPVIREKIRSFSQRAVGIAFVLVSLYFVIYIFVALVDPDYMAYLTLTELWAVAFAVLGAGFLIKQEA